MEKYNDCFKEWFKQYKQDTDAQVSIYFQEAAIMEQLSNKDFLYSYLGEKI